MCPACGAKDFDANPPSAVSPVAAAPAYSAPAAAATNQSFSPAAPNFVGASKSMVPASIGSRFVAYMIDAIILAVLSAIPVAIAYVLTLPTKNQGFSIIMALGMLIGYIIPFVYFTVMPASEERATYGKKAMGLKLLTVQGERLSKSQAFIRVLLTMVIPMTGLLAITISLGGMAVGYKDEFATSVGIAWLIAMPLIVFGPYVTAFFNPNKQTLYDMIVKTVVVKR